MTYSVGWLQPILVVCIFVGVCVGGAQGEDARTQQRAVQLVEQLASPEFASRERAAAALVQLGAAGLEALNNGRVSPNREVRERCQRILTLLNEVDFRRRLREFEIDTDPDGDYGLPAWPTFRDGIGQDSSARSLFVSMQEEEAGLLAATLSNHQLLNAALSARCDELREAAQFSRQQARLGSMAAVLFVAGDDRAELTPAVRGTIYNLCRDTTLEAAIKSGPKRQPLVRLIERWMGRDHAQPAAFVLDIGLRCEIDASLPKAQALLRQPAAPQTDRLYSCLCLAKFGGREDFELLEAQLEDVTICAQAQVDQEVVATQFRDLALAALVQLAGQDLADYGFDRLQRDRDIVFQVFSLGFRDPARRDRALTAWRDFRRASGSGN
jgi:hypothetical protein